MSTTSKIITQYTHSKQDRLDAAWPEYQQTKRRIRLSAVIRVSRVNDRAGDSFMAPDEQRAIINAWCAANNAIVVSEHDETDSVSGSTTDREGLQAAMAEALSGVSDGLIVARVNRFSRNLVEGLTELKKLQLAGKLFVAPADGINGNIARTQDFGAKILLWFLLLIAEWQLDQFTEGWDRSAASAVERGVARNEPFGYRRDVAPPGTPKHELHKFTRRLIVVPEQARVVRRIFKRRAAGASWHTITREINEMGVPPTKGGQWSYNSVHNIATNRVYLGELRLDFKATESQPARSYVNPAAHKAIVPLALFEAAQATNAKTAERTGHSVGMLAGLVRCASCGGRMSVQNQKIQATSRQPVKHVRYYRCRNIYSWGRCPRGASVNADALEALVKRQLATDHKDNRFVAATSTAELEAATDERVRCEADEEAFATSDAVVETTRIRGQAWFDKALLTRTRRTNAAREREDQLRSGALLAQAPPRVLAAWNDDDVLTDAERRQLLALCYAVIAVKPSADDAAARAPIDHRVKIWRVDQVGMPENLPGRVAGKIKGRAVVPNAITPIIF